MRTDCEPNKPFVFSLLVNNWGPESERRGLVKFANHFSGVGSTSARKPMIAQQRLRHFFMDKRPGGIVEVLQSFWSSKGAPRTMVKAFWLTRYDPTNTAIAQ